VKIWNWRSSEVPLWETSGASGLNWSDFWKNKPVKQNSTVAAAVLASRGVISVTAAKVISFSVIGNDAVR